MRLEYSSSSFEYRNKQTVSPRHSPSTLDGMITLGSVSPTKPHLKESKIYIYKVEGTY